MSRALCYDKETQNLYNGWGGHNESLFVEHDKKGWKIWESGWQLKKAWRLIWRKTAKCGRVPATCEGSCNWAEFATEIFRLAGKDTKVQAITTQEYGAPANRPAHSVLENYMFKMTNGYMFADWHDAIEKYLKELK